MKIFDEIDGWMYVDELEFLMAQVKGKEGIEIGSWKGRSTIHLLQVCKSLVIIDHFKGTPDNGLTLAEQAKGKGQSIFSQFAENLSKYDFINDVKFELMKMISKEAWNLIDKSRRFDFLFIDGNHTYRSTSDDMRMWVPLLKDNGILMQHDYQTAFPGVQLAVEENFRPSGIVNTIAYKYMSDIKPDERIAGLR